MYTLYLVVWPLVFITFATSLPWETRECPRECVCLIEDLLKKVICDVQDKQQLKTIPTRFPTDTQYISLKGNRISTIPVGAFQNLRDLRHLDLTSNELRSLPQSIFQGLASLYSLNLSKNKLGQLPSALLQGLNSLQDLYLDGNVLENLPKNFFQGLTSLRRLYLDSNNFNTLSRNIFGVRGASVDGTPNIISNLTSLVELLLSHNGISRVQHDSFNKMSDLKRLKLNNNNITTLPRGIFRDLKSLRLLSLYKNPFQCTCSLKWLKDWIVQNRKYVTVFYPHLIRCDGPARLRGKSLLQVRNSEFGCGGNHWSEWSSWGGCSKRCNNGRQTRTRTCASGACEGSNRESRWCNTHKCDIRWSQWTSWTPCSVTCAVGYQTRSRSTRCTRSPCQQQLESEVRACPRKACPSYTEWSSWSMCDAVCGQGRQVRKRECTTTHLGVICPGSRVEVQDCKIRDCAAWTEWGSWSSCSKSCSKGKQTRKRDCVIVHGVKEECTGSGIETRECTERACPIDGGWSSWLPWSTCSKTCGLGINIRYRRCSDPYPQHGGAKCEGQPYEVTQCIQGVCADDTSEFTPWSPWSRCSTQCGRGFKSRKRICRKQDPMTGIDMCLGNSIAYQYCEENQCDGRWGVWSRWSRCYGDCKQGRQFRWRFCVNDHGQVGYICKENKTVDIQHKSCQPSTCHYNPVWSTWSSWSACSKSCSTGSKRRWRYCVTKILGKPCPGSHESKAPCNAQRCPIHGGWSSWTEWGECDKKCDGGIKQRNRTCSEPRPEYNGNPCIGNSEDKSICNTIACPMLNDGKVGERVEVKEPKDQIVLDKIPECPAPEKPSNGKYTMKTQRDGHMFLEYKCNEYYRNHASSTIRYCMNGNTWSGEPAECVADCGEIKERRPERRLREIKSITNLTDFWPWQVALEVPRRGINCGGTLIGDQWVLTAAHCVLIPQSQQYFQEIKVILGTHNLTDKSSAEVQVIPVNITQHHRDFDWDLLKSDIAILKLARKVHITKYVHPVCLPKTNRRKRLIREGKTGVMVGWGSRQQPHLLRQIPLPVVKLQDCAQTYKKNKYTVTRRMLCAGFKRKPHGTCKKDSGGGFVFLDRAKRRNRWVLGGIVSWRYPYICDIMGKYSVFTDVTKHVTWILNKMNDI